MGLPLPDVFRPDLVALGITWPEADEWAISAKAGAWAMFEPQGSAATGQANLAVASMMDSNRTLGLGAFSAWWARVGGVGGHMHASGLLAGGHAAVNQSVSAYITTYKLTIYALIVQHHMLAHEMEALTQAGHPEAAVALAEATERLRTVCIESYNTVVSLLDGLGVELAATVDKLCRAAIQVLDKRPIHNSPDRVTLPQDMKPISERLPEAQENPNGKGRFPDTAEPGTVYVRTNPATGEILQYATYGDDGYIVKRVDVQGAEHFDKSSGRHVPTPHVVYYQRNTNPATGEVRIKQDDSTVREAHPEEIP